MSTQPGVIDLIERYYAAFNCAGWEAMLAHLADDVAHDLNRGARETGIAAQDGTHAVAEYVVHGEYKKTDAGLPEARGQKYVLPGDAFFDIRDGKIARVSNYYNLDDWIAQIST